MVNKDEYNINMKLKTTPTRSLTTQLLSCIIANYKRRRRTQSIILI